MKLREWKESHFFLFKTEIRAIFIIWNEKNFFGGLLNSMGAQKKAVDYRALFLLCMGHMVADLNTNALPALLPFLKDALGLSYAMAGTIILFSNLTSSVIQPIFGHLADRRSLHWFLPAGCFLAGLGIALLGWAPNYPTILILVILSGLGVAIYHPEGWRIANFFAGEKKATGMSIFAVGGNLGFAFGPPLGIFFVKHFGLKGSAVFIVPGVVMAAVFLFSRFWRIRRPAASPPSAASASFWASIRPAVYPMSLLLGMIMFRSWTHIGLITFIPFYYINYMKGDPMQAGTLLFAFLAAGTVGTIVGGPLADRFGHKKIILFSLGCTGPLLVLFLLSSGFWSFFWLTLAGFILIFSFSISMAMGQSFFPKNVGMASG
ncbi:MAG: arabinose efflux permease family protein, partial [Deltaproteobacteria bacterium]|nr:arabinose efflux permease family protein [Deltaproteobacteria bacterium]